MITPGVSQCLSLLVSRSHIDGSNLHEIALYVESKNGVDFERRQYVTGDKNNFG